MTPAAAKFAGIWLLLRSRREIVGTCWIWTGARSKDGYGVVIVGGKRFLVHRLAWYFDRGEIPKGMGLLHDPEKCRSRACFNPAHLRPGTAKENAADRVFNAGGKS